ncbi:tetratricopeptide repeat protein [Candidatus Desantisbacteria bacterium]|nr:tetratricopeptide repeat protein [Candidatus Desantisbacteria bacterium]
MHRRGTEAAEERVTTESITRSSSVALVTGNLAISCFSFGEYEKAISYYQQALCVFQGILNERDSHITCLYKEYTGIVG